MLPMGLGCGCKLGLVLLLGFHEKPKPKTNGTHARSCVVKCAHEILRVSFTGQTVGFEIFAEERDISMMGMVLTLAILLLLATLWAKARYFNRSNVSEHVVQGKIIDRYIKTGEVSRA